MKLTENVAVTVKVLKIISMYVTVIETVTVTVKMTGTVMSVNRDCECENVNC